MGIWTLAEKKYLVPLKAQILGRVDTTHKQYIYSCLFFL